MRPFEYVESSRKTTPIPGGSCLDTDDLAYSLDRLDVIHDHGEPQVHPRADGERRAAI